MPIHHKLGYKPDLPDFRDYRLRDAIPINPASWKKETHNVLKDSVIRNQGNSNSCTGFAWAGLLQLVHKSLDSSELFIYWCERVLEKDTKNDSGAEIRDGAKTIVKWGAAPRQLWPFSIDRIKTQPPKTVYNEASRHLINKYYRLESPDEIMQNLSNGYGMVAGVAVYESFDSQEAANTGVIPMPKKTEQLFGGHAIVILDYAPPQVYGLTGDKPVFLFRNSWGARWGRHGYGILPYDFVMNPNLSCDMWTIR
jgi:C1A family cysteine protease